MNTTNDGWTLTQSGFDPATARAWEGLFTLGSGNCTRVRRWRSTWPMRVRLAAVYTAASGLPEHRRPCCGEVVFQSRGTQAVPATGPSVLPLSAAHTLQLNQLAGHN